MVRDVDIFIVDLEITGRVLIYTPACALVNAIGKTLKHYGHRQEVRITSYYNFLFLFVIVVVQGI